MHQDFRIDPWIVQPSLNRIRSAAEVEGVGEDSDGSEIRPLGHKVMAVLLCLAERPGEVVTKEELFERAWDGAFTTDEALATVVYELRKALDDDARRPRYVETIRKRGYRLIAPVTGLGEAVSESESAEPSPAVRQPAAPTAPNVPEKRWPSWAVPTLAAAAGAAAAALAAATLRPDVRVESRPEPAPIVTPAAEKRTIRSLAVRPLESFTNECRQDFFAGSLTEMLIADLVFASPLDIIPTPDLGGSFMPGIPQDAPMDPRADAVLEGSVLRSGDRLWISIQLVDSLGGQILWGGTYERELSDSLDLQQELSREISSQIVSQVTSGH